MILVATSDKRLAKTDADNNNWFGGDYEHHRTLTKGVDTMQLVSRQKLKQAVSWIIGVPAFFIAFSGSENISYWWMPIVSMGILTVILAWNGLIESPRERVN